MNLTKIGNRVVLIRGTAQDGHVVWEDAFTAENPANGKSGKERLYKLSPGYKTTTPLL